MDRIEYEYPLFKVYYSNNSNNSNIRGNPALKQTHQDHHCSMDNVNPCAQDLPAAAGAAV